jgi:hypothetical protein
MQDIKAPSSYDWSGFKTQKHGFVSDWSREHFHQDGEHFNINTVWALINGNYGGGSGPLISNIVTAALAEGLIHEAGTLDEAA